MFVWHDFSKYFQNSNLFVGEKNKKSEVNCANMTIACLASWHSALILNHSYSSGVRLYWCIRIPASGFRSWHQRARGPLPIGRNVDSQAGCELWFQFAWQDVLSSVYLYANYEDDGADDDDNDNEDSIVAAEDGVDWGWAWHDGENYKIVIWGEPAGATPRWAACCFQRTTTTGDDNDDALCWIKPGCECEVLVIHFSVHITLGDNDDGEDDEDDDNAALLAARQERVLIYSQGS